MKLSDEENTEYLSHTKQLNEVTATYIYIYLYIDTLHNTDTANV